MSVEELFVEDELRLAQEGLKDSTCEELKLAKQSYVPSIAWFGSHFQNLKVLNISWCNLEDLSGISGPIKGEFEGIGLPNLQELYASYNKITDLRPLRGHRCLEVLDLEGNNIEDEEQLQNLSKSPQLQVLNFLYNPLTDKKDVYNIPIIKKLCPNVLYLDDVDISTVKGVGGSGVRLIRALRESATVVHTSLLNE